MFAGDVGCGKTALAESFGCDLADTLNLPVFLYRLKLSARGSGLVGEMTTLIGDAFAHLLTSGRKARGRSGPRLGLRPGRRRGRRARPVPRRRADAPRGPRRRRRAAGRRGQPGRRSTSRSSSSCAPTGSARWTRRSCAAPPRSSHFSRPGDAQRRAVLAAALAGTGIDAEAIGKLAELTGPAGDRPGYTYSDLTQRLIPAAILAAFPDKPLTADILLRGRGQHRARPPSSGRAR